MRMIRGRYACSWYDTSVDHRPGVSVRLFDRLDAGGLWVTNVAAPGRLARDGSVVTSVGARVAGLLTEQEDALLDYFLITLRVGDVEHGAWFGSVLVHKRFEDWSEVFTKTVRDLAVAERGCPVSVTDYDSAWIARDWLVERGIDVPAVPTHAGHELWSLVVVLASVPVSVTVDASPDLPSPTTLRVTLSGLGTREVS